MQIGGLVVFGGVVHLTRCLRTLRARLVVAARGAHEGLWLEQVGWHGSDLTWFAESVIPFACTGWPISNVPKVRAYWSASDHLIRKIFFWDVLGYSLVRGISKNERNRCSFFRMNVHFPRFLPLKHAWITSHLGYFCLAHRDTGSL